MPRRGKQLTHGSKTRHRPQVQTDTADHAALSEQTHHHLRGLGRPFQSY